MLEVIFASVKLNKESNRTRVRRNGSIIAVIQPGSKKGLKSALHQQRAKRKLNYCKCESIIVLAFSDSSIAIFIIVLNSGLIDVLPGISYQLPSFVL